MITETKKGLHLDISLTQRFKVFLDLENGSFTAYGTYELRKGGSEGSKKTLGINIPDFSINDGRRGLHAKFEDNEDSGMHSASVKGSREYWENPGLKRVFEESIEPILKERLPVYMTRLMRFDADQ